jgi:hypothetical protein
VEAVRLLGVSGAHLLHVRVVELRLDGDVAARPHVDALGADVDVDARVVPGEHSPDPLRRMHAGRRRQLLDRLARVALPVCLQVVVIYFRTALDEHDRGVGQA